MRFIRMLWQLIVGNDRKQGSEESWEAICLDPEEGPPDDLDRCCVSTHIKSDLSLPCPKVRRKLRKRRHGLRKRHSK